MKLSIIYCSKSGHTAEMAAAIAEGMQLVDGAEVKTFPLENIDKDWVIESQCIVIGTPIYMASLTGELKLWLESAGQYKLAGKIGGAFATADYVHGGGELGIRDILDHLMVYGMLIYSGGGSVGKPVIHLGPVALSNQLEESKETFRIYGQRMAAKTKEIFG